MCCVCCVSPGLGQWYDAWLPAAVSVRVGLLLLAQPATPSAWASHCLLAPTSTSSAPSVAATAGSAASATPVPSARDVLAQLVPHCIAWLGSGDDAARLAAGLQLTQRLLQREAVPPVPLSGAVDEFEALGLWTLLQRVCDFVMRCPVMVLRRSALLLLPHILAWLAPGAPRLSVATAAAAQCPHPKLVATFLQLCRDTVKQLPGDLDAEAHAVLTDAIADGLVVDDPAEATPLADAPPVFVPAGAARVGGPRDWASRMEVITVALQLLGDVLARPTTAEWRGHMRARVAPLAAPLARVRCELAADVAAAETDSPVDAVAVAQALERLAALADAHAHAHTHMHIHTHACASEDHPHSPDAPSAPAADALDSQRVAALAVLAPNPFGVLAAAARQLDAVAAALHHVQRALQG